MQQAAPPLRIHDSREQLLPRLPELLYPRFVLGPELLLQLAPQTLRQGRAETAGGNGNLQGAALHHSGIVKVAPLRVVDNVTQNPLPFRLPKHSFVQIDGRSGCDHQKRAIEIGWIETACFPRS